MTCCAVLRCASLCFAVPQVFSEQAQQAAAAGIQPAELAAQQQFAAQQAQHMAQQAQQHMGYLMPAGLSPEFQQQYQASGAGTGAGGGLGCVHMHWVEQRRVLVCWV